MSASLLLLCLAVSAATPPADEPSRPRVYTNEDLDRVAPRRGETGATAAPPRPAPAEARAGSPRERDATRGAEYWRREAERVRDRVEDLQEKARDIRLRIEERRRRPGVRPYSDPRIEAWEARAAALEARAHALQERLEDRARTSGALPGWLR